MRLIEMLLVLSFVFQPWFKGELVQVQASLRWDKPDGMPITADTPAGCWPLASVFLGGDNSVWATGLDISARRRQRRNPRPGGASGASGRRVHRGHRRGGASEPSRLPASSVVVVARGPQPVNSFPEQPPAEVGQRRGRPPKVPTEHVCCVSPNCRGYGKFGAHPDHHLVGAGSYPTRHNGPRQIYRCEWCQQRFSETQGTVFFGLKTPAETVYRALTALAEGVSIRSTARIFGERPQTILLWLRRAGEHSQQVSDYLLRNLHVSQAQLDELWTFVRKKEKTLSTWEQLHTEYGDTWIWVVFDPVNKLVLALLVGEREEEQAVGVLSQLKARLRAGCWPLFTSDQLPHYLKALLRVFGRWVQPQRQGERGRFPNPRLEAPDDLLYATVNKQKQNGRVVSVTTQVVLGKPTTIARQLEATRPGLKINTSFIERFNLTLRHLVSRLRRKGLTFSKKRKYLVWHLQLATAYYHLVRPHGSLRQRLPEPIPTRGSPKLWQPRTPAMAAGLTDHPWSMQELLSFRVPPAVAT